MTDSTPNILLAVGNTMMGDDGAGPLLADMMAANPVVGWLPIDGGATPENVAHHIQALHPNRVLIVDAADMGLMPGDVRLIDPDDIAEMFIMSTHNMPLSFLIERLKETVPDVIFLGIQPDIVGFYYPMTEKVRQAVETVYHQLTEWEGNGPFAQLTVEEA
ncbi:hydrogenase maturation peptidase HycI [Pectobacterium versatile]|uniref:hydrogenase maturation peptidase HycI n=1 Tax=Pectobacterium versatile TaxID=2488639 RepID=UPI000B7BA71F|nr:MULTISPECIES: hydrogenase maturation peptidase HycI [Pectobacterium]ASN86545.1 Hydrogenase maturation peptidase HycI [Pectobacterium versatile]MBA0161648.1 hydrogenase maturation peptidase HycI [Pectobacterium versatile]MBD0846294.1 hydrogenase 3 maturation protease [Pectobacterium carotovorum subsp. carotovorum]MBK4825177.1 HycI peptidase [Pectobacterium carotovorum subsp. carotovorum]MBN3058819.1 hydrogenase maturation peptidase HycI [Pectobacterium versatile]